MTGGAMTGGIPASDPAEIAAAHLAAGRTAEARALYEEVLRAEPTHVRALCGLGAVALRLQFGFQLLDPSLLGADGLLGLFPEVLVLPGLLQMLRLARQQALLQIDQLLLCGG